MKTIELQGIKREEIGSKSAKLLRRDGFVPCVLYGEDNESFYVNERELKALIYSPYVYWVKLNIGGKTYDAIVREFQFHPVTDKAIHIDFLQLIEKKEVSLTLPVTLVGNAIGVRNGGRLKQPLRRMQIKALPKDLLSEIEINIENLKIGMIIRVSDLSFPGVTFMDSASNVVVAIKTARGAVNEEEEDGDTPAEDGVTAEAQGADSPQTEEKEVAEAAV